MEYSQIYKAGTDKRRYEPEQGIHKHNKRIHNESHKADVYGKLPFNFSKPKKSKRHTLFSCDHCGDYLYSTINTVGVVCSNCSTYSSVTEVDLEET